MHRPWRFIPIDDIGYIDSEDFLRLSDQKAKTLINQFESNRYSIFGYRNWRNLWRSTLGLDSTRGKRIHDYGCGFGMEALQFCRSGNQVHISDIFLSNVEAAKRALSLFGYTVNTEVTGQKMDIFYSNGVLHHTPNIKKVLEQAVDNLTPSGEIRLLLYSDKAWTLKTGEALPSIDADVTCHPAFQRYVNAMDDVGEYADWYNREKLALRVGDFLNIETFDYITPTGMFATTTLRPRCA